MRSKPSLLSNSLGIQSNESAESRLNLKQIYALEELFVSNPVVQAARTVLSGQLLSGGISLRKDRKDVELQPAFRDHLSDIWLPFAQDVIDSFLKWGMVVISYEENEDTMRRSALLAKRRKLAEDGRVESERGSKVSKATESALADAPVIVPIVPMLGSYEIAFCNGGRTGYKRKYFVYSNAPGQSNIHDEEARVVVRTHPDGVGNVNSPLASVFDYGSFVSTLTELAVTAEIARSRPRMITQMRKKDHTQLDAGNLFFDSESRAVQSGVDVEESAAQARALQMQHSLCSVINKLQTRGDVPDHNTHSFGGHARHSGKQPYMPPDVPPSLFTVPKDQEIAPAIAASESRGDLEALTRLSTEHFSAAFGVPADLVFSGRFSGKSTSQLSLLNTTVSQLAKAVNNVLTLAYHDIYAESSTQDVGQLQLLTSPLSATDEVLNLYQAGLIPVNLAMPAVLHAIGSTKDDIDEAVKNALSDEQEKKKRTERDDYTLPINDKKNDLEPQALAIEQVGQEHREDGRGNTKE